MNQKNKSKVIKDKKNTKPILPNVTCSNIFVWRMEYGMRLSPSDPYDEEDENEFYYDLCDIEKLQVIYEEEIDYLGEKYPFTRDYRMGFNVDCFFSPKSLKTILNVKIVIGGGELDLENFPLIDLKLSLFCLLEFNQEISDKKHKEALAIQSLAILWPYAREYVADTLRKGGDFPVLLPIIDPFTAFEQGLFAIKDGIWPSKKHGF